MDDSMKKRNIFTAVGASVIGAGAASYFLMNDHQKTRLKDKFSDMVNGTKMEQQSTFEKAGQPDQTPTKEPADLENSKMVSEGSQFGVQYYNEKREENEVNPR